MPKTIVGPFGKRKNANMGANNSHIFSELLAGYGPNVHRTEHMKEERVKSFDELNTYLGAALLDDHPKALLTSLAQLKPAGAMRELGQTVTRLSIIAQQVLVQTGRIEAEYLRRPNCLTALYTTSLAPAATIAFSVQPGQGNTYYRLLGFLCGDQQGDVFGFTSLKVGGQEHVQFSQSTPVAPVTNFVPWNMFMLREASFKANLAPWSGQVFDNQTPVTGIVANGTVAATTDAFTGAARLTFLCQIDPCGFRYAQIQNASQKFWGSLRGNLDIYAPLMMAPPR